MQQRSHPTHVEGIFAVYKDAGMTSHDVVDLVRRATGVRKVGHGGTLDPCATGVLVVGVGRSATKKLATIAAKEKEYVATVRLGWTSRTDDREGPLEEGQVAEAPTREQVQAALDAFVGRIVQVPPAFSALKIGGRPAYKLARANKPLALQPRSVEIMSIDLLDYEWPDLRIRTVTGPGVYIRALARDLGARLGTGAYLAELERTRVGTFTKDSAIRLSDLMRIQTNDPDPH